VQAGDALLEVETDKVNMEVEAPAGGVLAGISVREGQTVPVTQTIGYILQATGSFAGALTFVGVSAAIALLSMLLLVGDIHRVELKTSLLPGAGA